MTMPSLPTMIHPGRHAPLDAPGPMLDGNTLLQRADVVQLLQRFDALNHLSACYFRATTTMGDHPAARQLLAGLLDDLQRDAEPVLGRFPDSDRFIDALELLQ